MEHSQNQTHIMYRASGQIHSSSRLFIVCVCTQHPYLSSLGSRCFRCCVYLLNATLNFKSDASTMKITVKNHSLFSRPHLVLGWAFALILNVSIPFNRKKRTLHFVYFKFVPFSFIGKKDFLLLPWATALSPPTMPPPPPKKKIFYHNIILLCSLCALYLSELLGRRLL